MNERRSDVAQAWAELVASASPVEKADIWFFLDSAPGEIAVTIGDGTRRRYVLSTSPEGLYRDKIDSQGARIRVLDAQLKERDTVLDNAAKRIKWLEDKVAGLEEQAKVQTERIHFLAGINKRQADTIVRGQSAAPLKPSPAHMALGKIRELCLSDNNGFLHRFFDPHAVTLVF